MSRTIGRRCSQVALSLAMMVAACGGSTTEAKRDPSGTYTLISINGKPLPGVVSISGDRTTEMLGGSVVVSGDHRFSFTGRTRTSMATGVAEITKSGTGQWTLRDEVLLLIPDDPTLIAPTALAWDGGTTLTANDPYGTVPVILVFER